MKKISAPFAYFLVIVCLVIVTLGIYFYSVTREQRPIVREGEGGIYGKVMLYIGNCMPGAEVCKITSVARKIYIREPADAEMMELTHLKAKPPLVKQVESNNRGFYQAELSSGTYSIFVEDDGEEYCNSFGLNGEPCQVAIGKELVEYNIKIDHAVW